MAMVALPVVPEKQQRPQQPTIMTAAAKTMTREAVQTGFLLPHTPAQVMEAARAAETATAVAGVTEVAAGVVVVIGVEATVAAAQVQDTAGVKVDEFWKHKIIKFIMKLRVNACECSPVWVPEFEFISADCSFCKKELQQQSIEKFLVYRCSYKPERMHALQFIFHADTGCFTDFLETSTAHGRDARFELIDAIPAHEEFMKRHERLGGRCHSCKCFEEKEAKFKQCGTCKTVKYCSTVCQRKDWDDHKKECKFVGQTRGKQKKRHCACFSEGDQWFYERMDPGICSNIKCSTKIPYNQPVVPGYLIKQCDLGTGKEKHVIMTTYCSRACQDAATSRAC